MSDAVVTVSDPATDSASMLAVEDLSISVMTRAGTARVVSELSFAVPSGGSLGIVGESGSGKSMTAMAIGGLLPRAAKVRQGSIRINGFEMVGASGKQLRRVRGEHIGMVFQDPLSALNPAFAVGDQIAERLRYVRGASRSAAWSRAVDLLDEVGIPNAERRARDYPHQFSGGMRQRIVIAAAIACEPQVLIADEPTTALDVTIQAQILDLFDRLRREHGLALVFISHDLAVVESVSDQVLVMYAGQEVESGTCQDVIHRPLHPYSEALLASVPDPDHYQEELRVIRGTPPSPALYPPFCRFADRCEHAMDECRARPIEIRVTDGRRARCVLVDGEPR
jgi:oligopeptide/dipeptide ABC transporter ATP-binding protein